VQFGLIVSGDLQSYRQGVESMVGAVVGMQDFPEHPASSRLICLSYFFAALRLRTCTLAIWVIGRQFALPLCISSSHDEDGTGCQVHEPVGATAEHSLVEFRMACRADNKQVSFQFEGKLDDIAHGMPGQDVGVELYPMFLGHAPRALENRVKATSRSSDLLPDLFDELGQVVDFLNRYHVKLGVVLLGNRDS
jgi:hypothetical protein